MKRTPEEGAVLAAVATMPFGGLVHVRLGDGPITLERVAGYLEALGAVLMDHSERCQATTRELRTLRRDVEGMRRLLGVGATP